MYRSAKVRSFTIPAMVVALAVGGLFAFTVIFGGDSRDGGGFPAITLGLTAEARESLQQSGTAFPSNDAGFSAYYRVPDGAGGFSLDKNTVDQVLFSDPDPTLRRMGPGALIDIGAGHTVGTLPIKNIDGLVTSVNVYYDEQGWIVAYLPRGSGASRAWQAVDLNAENPSLNDVSRTTLMDAVNDILVEALNAAPLSPNELGYYHWEYPTATDFLMIATARGNDGIDTVSFAVPGSFAVREVSVSMWVGGTGIPCARTFLDMVSITGDQCNRGFHHVLVNLSNFNSLSAHTVELEHFGLDQGASGALLMLVYSAP